MAASRLATPDSRALLQRERHGSLFVDVERRLELTLRGLWDEQVGLVAYPVDTADAGGAAAFTLPHAQADGWRLPEVLDDRNGVGGIDRYRLIVAHLAGHRRWTRPLAADNLSPLQRLVVECFEDSRVDALLLRRYPGLRRAMLAGSDTPNTHLSSPATPSALAVAATVSGVSFGSKLKVTSR